jgi:hypothetical protein
MKKFFMMMATGLSAIALMGASGCKEESFVETWTIKSEAQSLRVTAAFSKNYEVNMEGEFPVKNLGSVRIFPDSENRFTVDLNVKWDMFGDSELVKVETLPSGVQFPSLITNGLYAMTLADVPNKHKVIAYFDSPNGSLNGTSLLVGLAIQLQGVSSNFPTGSVTQNYFHNNRKASVFTIYGPKLDVDGKVLVPGGLFVAADLKAIQGVIGSLAQRTGWEVSDEHKGLSQDEIEDLVEEMLEEAKDAGIIRER